MSSPDDITPTKEKTETYSTNDTSSEQGKPLKHVYSKAEKKLVRKINYTVMPLVCLILFVQVYIDPWNATFLS